MSACQMDDSPWCAPGTCKHCDEGRRGLEALGRPAEDQNVRALRDALRGVPRGGASGSAPEWIVRLHRAACAVAGIEVRDSPAPKRAAKQGNGIELRPGRFYRSRTGDIWCCYKVDPDGPIQARAHCVQVASSQIEYFFADGRYDEGGKREHCLAAEVPADDVEIERRLSRAPDNLTTEVQHALELSTRAVGCLHRAGIVRLEQLVTLTRSHLLGVRGIGLKTVREIEELLAEVGLSLRGPS